MRVQGDKPGEGMTHSRLVDIAGRWLVRERCPVVITEMQASPTESPDALGFDAGGRSVLIECKASLADFRADSRKSFRVLPDTGMGTLRYYLAPMGMIPLKDLPPRWGLLEVNPRGCVTCAHRSQVFPAVQKANEVSLLVSLVRRISRPGMPGVSVKCYAYENKNRSTLLVELPEEGPGDDLGIG